MHRGLRVVAHAAYLELADGCLRCALLLVLAEVVADVSQRRRHAIDPSTIFQDSLVWLVADLAVFLMNV